MRAVVLALAMVLLSGCSGSGGASGWRLAWHDEFDEATCPDPGAWRFEHGFVRNEELQWYQRRNASCHGGVLDLTARHAHRPNPKYEPGSPAWQRERRTIRYTSASLVSRHTFTYGRLEMRARIDPRRGSWPAFWSLGADGRWPASGEIDVMEAFQGLVRANVCKPRPNRCEWSIATRRIGDLGGGAWARRFHVWRMDWTPRRIDLSMDGQPVNRFRVADAVPRGRPNPYVGKARRMLLSQAIGGTNGGDPSATRFPVRLQVDYVRLYRRAGR